MTKTIKTFRFLLILILTTSLGCGTTARFEWTPFERDTSLEDTEFTQAKMDSLTNFLENNLETTGMMILQNGKILYEYGDIKEVSYIASCRKSVLSILYGKYVENGTIDLNETIGDMGIDEDKGLLEIEKTATVDNIITARSGVFYEPVNAGLYSFTSTSPLATRSAFIASASSSSSPG